MLDQITRCVAVFVATLTFGTTEAGAQVVTPEGCSPLATVHRNSCIATTVFSCAAGYQMHTYAYGKFDGVLHYSKDWVFNGYSEPGLDLARTDSSTLVAPIDNLLTKGWMTEEGNFALSTKLFKNRTYALTGESTLGIETVVFNDTVFRAGSTYRDFARQAGGAGFGFEVEFLYSEDRDLRIEGVWTRTSAGGTPDRLAHDIRAVYFEGEAGFMAATSEYGCG